MANETALCGYGALKTRLSAGEVAFAFWSHLVSPSACELLAQAGFDAVLIDMEHGSGSYTEAIAQMRAVQGAGCTSLLRVPWNDPVEIKRALDAGAAGIMVPAVSSAAEARAAVSACRYPPRGTRGAAPGVIRASGYGRQAADYARTIDEALLVIVQIETVAGVEAVDEIAAVDGVDMLFAGPMDLSGDAGLLGEFEHPEVVAMIERIEEAAGRHGRLLGSIVFPGRDVASLLSRGCRLIVSHSDLDFLREGARKALATMHGLAGRGND
jgi:2-keto-3-deoxy-L-rhamnonate aldolase RhmA